MQIRFERISKRYGKTYAVRDLDLTIKSGALHFLLGPSGCGKTTTLRMLAGLEKPTEGKIFFDDKDVTTVEASERGIGMVFQNYALWPHMTVLANIEYGLKIKKMPAAELKARVDEVLDITQLGQYVDRLPGQLSGGQQQRVALARALAIRPTVLLLDEPLSNLDAKLRLEMRDNITRIHRKTRITTVYVTHDQKEALSMGTAISVMRAGILVQSAAPRELYHFPQDSFIAGFIGETNLVKGRVASVSPNRIEVSTNAGIIIASRSTKTVHKDEEVLVSVRPEALKVSFPGHTKTGGADSNRLPMTVDHLVYLGDTEQFQFKLKDGTLFKASVFNPPIHALKEHDNVECFVDYQDVLVLPSTGDLRSGT